MLVYKIRSNFHLSVKFTNCQCQSFAPVSAKYEIFQDQNLKNARNILQKISTSYVFAYIYIKHHSIAYLTVYSSY